MNTNTDESSILFTSVEAILFSLCMAATVVANKLTASHSSNKTTTRSQKELDADFLQKCHEIRLGINPSPRQSNFRVVCILLFEDQTTWIPGTNDEPTACIGGSICAERAALLQYRMQTQMSIKPQQKIGTVYIVTDCEDKAIPPGMLCREYMHGHDAIDNEHTRIVLQQADTTKEPWIVTLQEIYPHPTIYSGLDESQQILLGTQYESKIKSYLERLNCSDLKLQELQRKYNNAMNIDIFKLVESAKEAAVKYDNNVVVHPMGYGVAAYVVEREAATSSSSSSKLSFLTAHQRKAMEYGGTQDAVGQLVAQLNEHQTPVLLVQTDHFGIPHAPFAPARSILVEHGYGDCLVLVATQAQTGGENLEVELVTATDLAPHVPKFR